VELLQNIFIDYGLNVKSYERVHGGDINDAYCLITTSGKYFLKVNDNPEIPLMFEREAHGLDHLRKYSSLIIPQVIKTGAFGYQQYLLLEWLEKGVPKQNTWEKFGQGLALMHKQDQQYFGHYEDNYIGSRRQINDQRNDWPSFYSERRIMPLVKALFFSKMFSSMDIKMTEKFCLKFESMFPKEPPSLLHGDLWSGNYMIHFSGSAAIFDPAIYNGHREMDIGMTKLFGGFDQQFYDAYNETYPLEKDWQKRLPLTQLYPILVHAVLFGGHYISSAKSIITSFK